MRRFLLVAAMIVMGSGARALESVSVTIDSVSSTMTIRGFSIVSASATLPTSIIVSTQTLYRQTCVQNFDTTSVLVCSENVNLSTATESNMIGTMIPPAPTATTPATPTCFSISAGTNFYCKNGSASGMTRAGITRGR